MKKKAPSLLESFTRESIGNRSLDRRPPWSPSMRSGCPSSGNKLFPWRPAAGSSLGNPMKESVLGLSILSALSIAGICGPAFASSVGISAQLNGVDFERLRQDGRTAWHSTYPRFCTSC